MEHQYCHHHRLDYFVDHQLEHDGRHGAKHHDVLDDELQHHDIMDDRVVDNTGGGHQHRHVNADMDLVGDLLVDWLGHLCGYQHLMDDHLGNVNRNWGLYRSVEHRFGLVDHSRKSDVFVDLHNGRGSCFRMGYVWVQGRQEFVYILLGHRRIGLHRRLVEYQFHCLNRPTDR